MKLPIAVALLLVAVAVAARVPAVSSAGWVELDLTQTGAASDAALAQRAAGIAVEQYNAQTDFVISNDAADISAALRRRSSYPVGIFQSAGGLCASRPAASRFIPAIDLIRPMRTTYLNHLLVTDPRHPSTHPALPCIQAVTAVAAVAPPIMEGVVAVLALGSALSLAAVQSAEVFVPADVGRRAVVRMAFTGSALSLAAVQSAEVFVPADVGRRAAVRVAFTAGEQEGVLRRLLRGPGSTVAVKAEIAGTSHELHRYKLESFSTSG
ncbi:unnamed protein product [Closterium sp. NIES-64]|nr:unnamed protein product [Closterium sp. NIES-64]